MESIRIIRPTKLYMPSMLLSYLMHKAKGIKWQSLPTAKPPGNKQSLITRSSKLINYIVGFEDRKSGFDARHNVAKHYM